MAIIFRLEGRLVYAEPGSAIGGIKDPQSVYDLTGKSFEDFPDFYGSSFHNPSRSTGLPDSTFKQITGKLYGQDQFVTEALDAKIAPQTEQLTKDLAKKLNITDPAFLKEYAGQLIYDQASSNVFTIENGKIKWLPKDMLNDSYNSQRAIVYDARNGLQPEGKSSYQQSEAFRYANKTSIEYMTAESNDFGHGRQPAQDEYSAGGEVSQLGNAKVYLLKNGAWTSKKPPTAIPETKVDPTFQVGKGDNKTQAELEAEANTNNTNNNVGIAGTQDKQLTAQYKGDPGLGIAPKTFGGTQEEIIAQLKAYDPRVNPANLFYNGSDTAGVVPDNKTVNDLTNGTGDVRDVDVADAPDVLKNLEGWDTLTEEDKQLKIFEYNAQIASQDEDKQEWIDALEAAKEFVDPFYAQQLTLTQDEILRGFQNIEAASQQRLELIERNIARIDEDLATGTERLGIDKQAALTRLKSSFENTLVDLQNKVSDSGLAFSSRAGDLLSRAAVEKKDVQTSTSRSFARSAEDLNKQAGRSREDQESAREEEQRLKTQNLTALARESEKALGSQSFNSLKDKLDSGLKEALGGIEDIGGIEGTLEQERKRDIFATASTFKGVEDIDLSNI